MHKFKFQPPQQHRRSLQQPKNEHIGIINTLQKCSQILRQDRLWLRNQIKNNNNQVLEIFKLYARSSQLQQLQIKLRKYVQAVKNKLKSQQLSRFKDTLNLNNNAFSSISNVLPEPKRTNHQMKSIHTQQKPSNLKHNNSVELNRTTNARPNNSTDHFTNKMNNTLQVSNSLRHFQQMLKFKYNQEVIEERQSQNVTSARQARQENQNNCAKPLQQQIFDTFQNKKAGKSIFNNFVNKPIQEKYDFPTNFFKPSHKANQTVIQKKKEPWQFQKVAKKALYNYKDQHSQNKEDKCYQSRKEDMPAFDEMEDSIFDKHFDQSDKATNHFDLNGGMNLNGANNLNGGLNLPNNDYKSYSFNQPESIKSIHEVIGVPFRQQSNFQSTKYDYNDQTQESKNGQIDFRQSQKSNTDKNNFKVDQELFTPLQLLNQCRKFLKHRQNSSKKTEKINDEQHLKTNQIKQNRVIELPPEQIPECLFNRNNYKEQSQQKQMPNEHKQEESYLFPEIKQSNQKKQLQLSHHYEEEPAYVQESNTPHYEQLPTPQNQLEHQHMQYAPAQPASKLPDNFNIQEMLEDLMEVTEMNPFITKPSLLKYIISHRNSYILKDILDEKLKGSKEQICITNIASLLNNAYNSTNEEPYPHDDSQITLVYNLLDIDQKNYINKDDISSFLSQIEEAQIDNFEQISDQLWRLFDGADFDNEQQLTYWHFFLVKNSDQFQRVKQLLSEFQFQIERN